MKTPGIKAVTFVVCVFFLLCLADRVEALSGKGAELLERLRNRAGTPDKAVQSSEGSSDQVPGSLNQDQPQGFGYPQKSVEPSVTPSEPSREEPLKPMAPFRLETGESPVPSAQEETAEPAWGVAKGSTKKAVGAKPAEESSTKSVEKSSGMESESRDVPISVLKEEMERGKSPSRREKTSGKAGAMSELIQSIKDKMATPSAGKDHTPGSQVNESGKPVTFPKKERAKDDEMTLQPPIPLEPKIEVPQSQKNYSLGYRSFGELSDEELIKYAQDHVWSSEKSRKHNPPWTPPSNPKKSKKNDDANPSAGSSKNTPKSISKSTSKSPAKTSSTKDSSKPEKKGKKTKKSKGR